MRVLVTGAAGFIGSHVASALLTRGHDVWGIDAFRPNYSRVRKEQFVELVGATGEWRCDDRTVGSLTRDDLLGVDAVVHLAGQADLRESWDDFDTHLRDNVSETNSLARLVAASGVPRLVFASSSAVYGEAESYPVRETTPAHPRSPYGVTKLAGESLLEAHASAAHFDVVALRLFTAYGPAQREDMAIAQLIAAALTGGEFTLFGDGTQRRDFTYVADVARAFVASVETQVPRGMTCLNVGSTDEVSLRELIGLVESVSGKTIRVRERAAQKGDVTRTGADVARARDVLDWEPQTSLRQGIAHQFAFELDATHENWSASRGG